MARTQASAPHAGRAGYEQAAATASQGLQAQRLVEALKHAFALRAQLGDPGDCSGGPGPACFLNLTSLLSDMLSPSFAASLRCGALPVFDVSYYLTQWQVGGWAQGGLSWGGQARRPLAAQAGRCRLVLERLGKLGQPVAAGAAGYSPLTVLQAETAVKACCMHPRAWRQGGSCSSTGAAIPAQGVHSLYFTHTGHAQQRPALIGAGTLRWSPHPQCSGVWRSDLSPESSGRPAAGT